jgi:hypothetical protein
MNNKYIKNKSIKDKSIKDCKHIYNHYEAQNEVLLIMCSKTYKWCIKEHPIINSHIIYEERVILAKKLI